MVRVQISEVRRQYAEENRLCGNHPYDNFYCFYDMDRANSYKRRKSGVDGTEFLNGVCMTLSVRNSERRYTCQNNFKALYCYSF